MIFFKTFQVFGEVYGKVDSWKEQKSIDLITLGSKDLFILQKIDDSQSLVRVKVGVNSSSDLTKTLLCGYTVLADTNSNFQIITLSENGAIYRMAHSRNIMNDREFKDLSCEKVLCYVCRHCISFFKDKTKLTQHVLRQHFGPVKCEKCEVLFEDISAKNDHRKSCFFPCNVNGCEIKHKSKQAATKHYNLFLKSV